MGSASTPKNEPLPPRPKEKDKAVQQAAAEALARKKRGSGYRNTILTKSFMSDDAQAQLQTLGT